MGDMDVKIDELLMRVRALDPPVKRIDVQEGSSVYLLPVEDICFVTTRADGKALEFYAADGKVYVNFSNLGELMAKLADDPKFMRVHKSFIVNLLKVVTITTTTNGRDLKCLGWPDRTVAVASTNVKALEAYYRIG